MMAVTGYTRRRLDLFDIASSTQKGAGPYEEVFEFLRKYSPYEDGGVLQRNIRVNHVVKVDDCWFVELYLLMERIDVLEVSDEPDENDEANFAVPPPDRRFATRTCAIFDLESRVCVVEYVKAGPKVVDLEEILSSALFEIVGDRSSRFSLTPVIGEDFIKQVDAFDAIRQVRVIFKRPNPGWGDIGILADELEGSGDSRREVVLTAPARGALSKDSGIVRFLKRWVQRGDSSISDAVVEGRLPDDLGTTRIYAHRVVARHFGSMPISDDDQLYRNRFFDNALPFLQTRKRADED